MHNTTTHSKALVSGDKVRVVSGLHQGQNGVYLGRDACTNHAQVKIDGHTVLIVEVRRLQLQEDN